MATIAENLQTLINLKGAIKTALANQDKEPTDKMSTYAGLIDDLENPDKVVYCLTVDGENKTYANLYGQQRMELTATENDIRKGSTAFVESGCVEGSKDISGYICRYGYKIVTAGKEPTVAYEKGYKNLIITVSTFKTSEKESTAVNYVSVNEGVYEVNSTTKLSDISVDTINNQIKLGITVNAMSILRYFIVREEV